MLHRMSSGLDFFTGRVVRPSQALPAKNNAVGDTHVLSLPVFRDTYTRDYWRNCHQEVDDASLVDTDDTNSMGARYRDDTEGV